MWRKKAGGLIRPRQRVRMAAAAAIGVAHGSEEAENDDGYLTPGDDDVSGPEEGPAEDDAGLNFSGQISVQTLGYKITCVTAGEGSKREKQLRHQADHVAGGCVGVACSSFCRQSWSPNPPICAKRVANAIRCVRVNTQILENLICVT